MKLYKAVLIFLNAIIGTGIFFTPILITLQTKSSYTQFIVWVALGLIFLMYAVLFSKMIYLNPRKGGIYEYIKPLNKHLAFFSGWIEAFSVFILIAFLLNLSLKNISDFFPKLENYEWIIFGIILLLYGLIISRGVRVSNEAMFMFGIFSLVTFIVFFLYILYLYFLGNVDAVFVNTKTNFDQKLIALLVAAIFETYAGVEILGYFATKRNREILSKATIIGSIVVITFYISLVLFLVPLTLSIGDPYFYNPLGKYVYMLASIQILGTVFVWVNSLPNLLYRMSKDNNLPRIFEKLNHKRVPIYNLFLTIVISYLFAILTPIEDLIKVYFVGILFVYSTVAVSMLKLYARHLSKKYDPIVIISLALSLFPILVGSLYKKEIIFFIPVTIIGISLYLSREFQRNKTLVKIFHDIFYWLADVIWKIELKTDYPKIKKILGNLDGKIILDYGSSTGELSMNIAKDYKHAIIYASDISNRSLSRLEKKIKQDKIHNIIPLLDEPDTIYHRFEKFFDVIIVYHTITLIKDRKKFLKDIKRALKSNGAVLFVFYRRFFIFDAPKWVDNLWKLLMRMGFDVFVDEEKSLLYEKWYILARK